MYALCDVNAMYASCEKVFDPTIRKRPVVVLTNNDGCICAACGIAKSLGVGKNFAPYFQMKDQLQRIGAVVRSSNYELYADMSQRFMDVCTRFAPDFHIYSIDECFLRYGSYTPPEGWSEHGRTIRRTVWRQVRLPIGVGIGSTPTLAKVANHAAKRLPGFRGVAVIDNEGVRQQILKQLEVVDVWGIGRRIAARLRDMGIETAWQLSKTPTGLIRKHFGILVEGTVQELNGIVKLSWDDVKPAKQSIFSTRSFGQRVGDPVILRQAIATHTGIVARKLRKQGSLAGVMVVFAGNSPHDDAPYYKPTLTHSFAACTSDTQIMTTVATRLADLIYREGVQFYRCGVGVLNLVGRQHYQQDLFSPSEDNAALMSCIDQINGRYGRGTIYSAAQGTEQKFAMKRNLLSPQYTTRLSDLPIIRC